jgi:SAM-dependent methyltransferase
MTPLSRTRADGLVRFLAAEQDGLVVDFGCGWAELLLQALEAAPSATGVGFDLDEAAVAYGLRLAQQRNLDDRITLVVGDAKAGTISPTAAIAIGASQIWGPAVEDRQPVDYSAALTALRGLLPRGGRLVYAEGIWSAPPTPEAIAPLAGRPDEFVSLRELLRIAVRSGFQPQIVSEATLDEWDEFESGFAARFTRWLLDHPDDPAVDEIRERAEAQRDAYLGGYRGVLGMAYLGLVAV